MESAEPIDAVIDRIQALPADWHGAGTVPTRVLRAIARRVAEGGPVRRSAETGAGRTTLLLSHLSAHHTFFAVDGGGSIRAVLDCPVLKAGTTTLVEGPTQRTLPAHAFPEKLQLALIDGPHGYPFPDLEYYYLYPQIAAGGLLLVDDIRIPTIRRMFDIIRAGDMFELVEVVDRNTAFFRRTAAPLIDPESDGWTLQGYNRAYYRRITRLVGLGKRLPGWVRRLLGRG